MQNNLNVFRSKQKEKIFPFANELGDMTNREKSITILMISVDMFVNKKERRSQLGCWSFSSFVFIQI